MVSGVLFYSCGLIDVPRDLPMFYLGYFYMIWWCAVAGLIIGASQRAHGLGRKDLEALFLSLHFFWRVLLYGGVAAPAVREWALLQPSVQAYELIRAGMFGNVVRTYGDPAYETFALAVLTLIGLLLMRDARKYVVAE